MTKSSLLPESALRIPMPTPPKTKKHFHSDYNFGDRVKIDGDMTGVVTGFCWKYDDGHTIEVSWIHNGAPHTVWLQPWRLSNAD